MAFVEFQHVDKVYRMGEVRIEALRDVSFSVERGEICVIVGASGAGKTTLLNILGGMDTLSAGNVILDGTDIYRSELSKTGFVVFGNEGQGISAKVGKHANHRLLIPKAKSAGSESLNVGVAAAITISEFFRR